MSTSLEIGATASVSKKITSGDLERFAELTLDENPVHLSDTAAAESVFGKRVAHGMYVASFISAVLGTRLPGPGTIYLGQDLRFHKPVFIGDTITARVTVKEAPKPTRYELETECINQDGDVVISGTARVMHTGEPEAGR